MEVTCAKTKPHLLHVTPRHVPVLLPATVWRPQPPEWLRAPGAHATWLGLGETRNVTICGAEGRETFGSTEDEKQVDNGCFGGRSGCLFRSPCCGNSSVLKLFLGGKGLSLRLCVHPRVVVRRLSVLRFVGSFFACVWGVKKGVAVPSARGTTQIRGGVGRT